MKIVNVCPESFGANCYLIISKGHALAVDPAPSAEAIKRKAESEGAVIDGILLTHGHFDHIVSLDTLRASLSIPAYVHTEDAPMLEDGRKNAFFEFFGRDRKYAPAEFLMRDGDIIPVGEEEIKVIHTPGHSPGSVCFLCGDTLITGDTLFADSIGRCDLWGGSHEAIKASLAKLRDYNGSMRILPGHGPASLLGAALDNSAYFI